MRGSLRDWFVVIVFAVLVSFGFAGESPSSTMTSRDDIAVALVDRANAHRVENGLAALSVSSVLTRAAEEKARDMATKGYFAHTAPDGRGVSSWMRDEGYSFSYAGENLAIFKTDSDEVDRAWMSSPNHRANILSTQFTEIGIATAEGEYEGEMTVFVVQLFGTPR